MSNTMEKLGKMIRNAGPGVPAGVKPGYTTKVASQHTFAEPETVYNQHIKTASPQEDTNELELLMLKEAQALAGPKDKTPEDLLAKQGAASAMDGFDSQKIIEAVNSAKTVDEKIKAYLSASNAAALQTPKEKGE